MWGNASIESRNQLFEADVNTPHWVLNQTITAGIVSKWFSRYSIRIEISILKARSPAKSGWMMMKVVYPQSMKNTC
jgi:hypothetical protein